MRNVRSRAGLVAAAAALALGPAACGSDSEASDVASAADGAATVEQVSEGDYAFGADREMMAEAILAAFPEDSEATWEGDTLVLTLDGDATAMNAGFSQCRVVDELINEDDSAAIVFPNGRIECADILGAS